MRMLLEKQIPQKLHGIIFSLCVGGPTKASQKKTIASLLGLILSKLHGVAIIGG